MAIQKAIDRLQKYTTSRQINDILNTWNRPFTVFIYKLLINLPVLVYWEGNASQLGKRKELYKLISISGKSIVTKLPHGLIIFRSILIKSYFIDNQELVLDSLAPTQVSQAEAPSAETAYTETLQTKAILADIPLIESTA